MFKKEEAINKSAVTRERLYQVAMELFSSKGFESTTMRGIANEADVAPGAIYYYFESKESIVYEYYKQLHNDHYEALQSFLDKESSFSKRLHRVVSSKIEIALPHKNIARALYKAASDPNSPLSPFSKESQDIRLKALNIFGSVVTGSKSRFHSEIVKVLPEYLWLYQMGVILFWIYDNSKGSKKTFELIDKTVPLIDSLAQMIQSPLAAPFRSKIISALKTFAPELGRGVERIEHD